LSLIVKYSYLLFPLCFFLFKGKLKDRFLFVIALYGLILFALLHFYYDVPKGFKKYYQSFYTFLEYAFFTYIFWYNLRNNVAKTVILLASLFFIVFQIVFVISTTHKRLDSIPIGIETILLFVYIFYFFYEFSRQIKDTFIYNHYTFWIAVGVMIYLGGSFFFYILINNLQTDEVDKFGNMTYIAEIIKNLLFAFSIFMYKKYPVNKIHDHPKKIPNLDMI
jgi:hypothetical protein